MPYVKAKDDTKLYVKTWGAGRPVVMAHGWPLSADTFDDLALVLADSGFRAVAYDRRGFGRSDQPFDGYDYDTLADDLASVLEYVGGGDATLVGFSMGGGEVARYLSRHAHRGVAQAVLISSVVPYMLKTPDNPEGVAQDVFDDMTQQMIEDRAKFWSSFFKDFYGMGVMSSPVSDEIVEWSRNVAMQAGLKATLACAKAFATTDFRPDLAAFDLPTLVIHGTADKTVPIDATGRKVAAAVRDARLVELDGAPHGVLASHKNEVASAVLDFVAKR